MSQIDSSTTNSGENIYFFRAVFEKDRIHKDIYFSLGAVHNLLELILKKRKMSGLEVIGAGFGRTGTLSLYTALNILDGTS
jgi:hypothetical protein